MIPIALMIIKPYEEVLQEIVGPYSSVAACKLLELMSKFQIDDNEEVRSAICRLKRISTASPDFKCLLPEIMPSAQADTIYGI